jgi:gliding motility-associated-like protein
MKIILQILLLFFSSFAFSQADDCTSPTTISNVINFCSGNGFYTNVGSNPSVYSTPTCWPTNATEDVWFQFTAIGTDVLISLNGLGAGGTMGQPRIALYSGSCGGTLNEIGCNNGTAGIGTTQLYEGALTPGVVYLIRIGSLPNAEGTFEICLNNYTPSANPGADCGGAAFLCSQNPVSVATLSGGGLNNDEPEPGTCLDVPGVDEGNSAWFYWTCGTSGALTFDITPINSLDDIDFILYQLTGNDPCAPRTPIRCCSSSCLNATGSTGINTIEFDLNEFPGCQVGYNAYVQSINMTAGVSYALLVNNFSANTGYTINFNNNTPNAGTFAGPNPQITANPMVICAGQNITYDALSSINCSGGLQWNFLNGGSPVSATGVGPHSVTYVSPGNYVAILNGTDSQGCTAIDYVNVQVNGFPILNIIPSDTLCSGSNVIVPFSANPNVGVTYTWTTNTNQNLSGYSGGSGGSINQIVTNASNSDQNVNYTIVGSLNGCTDTAQFIATINPLIEPVFPGMGPFCLGQLPQPVLPLQSTNITPITGYWNTPNINTNLLGPTTYSFTPDPNQCADTTHILIDINDNPSVNFQADTLIGCSPLQVQFSTDSVVGANYVWLVNGINIGNTPTINYLFTPSGCYNIELQFNLNGCSASSFIPSYICVEADPIASFGMVPGVFQNPSELVYFQNGTAGAANYYWDFGDGSSSNEIEPSHLFNNTVSGASITLYAYSNIGCSDSITQLISYEEGLIYYIPNTFTPDQDEHNQSWKPIFTSGFDPYNFNLKVFNRWGEIVWETNNVNIGWDGTYGTSTHVQEGVYTWEINFKLKQDDNRKVISGSVNLIK